MLGPVVAVVLLVVAMLVVVLAQPEEPHASQQLAKLPTQALPPGRARHDDASELV